MKRQTVVFIIIAIVLIWYFTREVKPNDLPFVEPQPEPDTPDEQDPWTPQPEPQPGPPPQNISPGMPYGCPPHLTDHQSCEAWFRQVKEMGCPYDTMEECYKWELEQSQEPGPSNDEKPPFATVPGHGNTFDDEKPVTPPADQKPISKIDTQPDHDELQLQNLHDEALYHKTRADALRREAAIIEQQDPNFRARAAEMRKNAELIQAQADNLFLQMQRIEEKTQESKLKASADDLEHIKARADNSHYFTGTRTQTDDLFHRM